MWRYLLGGLAALLLLGAGWLLFHGETRSDAAVRSGAMTRLAPVEEAQAGEAAPVVLPEAPERSREQKRFDRYDKDRDAKITREEYLVQRRKAYARLDVNGDGTLSFDEWAVKATTKFAEADRDKSGAMTAPEFATTAVKRKGPFRANCPPVQTVAEES